MFVGHDGEGGVQEASLGRDFVDLIFVGGEDEGRFDRYCAQDG
jgi:hypothetical protein